MECPSAPCCTATGHILETVLPCVPSLLAACPGSVSAMVQLGTVVMICHPNGLQVTCGVALAVLKEVLAHIRRTLKKGGVRARLITSGTGDWRFLDIVSVRAGKLEVRRGTDTDARGGTPARYSWLCGLASVACKCHIDLPVQQTDVCISVLAWQYRRPDTQARSKHDFIAVRRGFSVLFDCR